MGSVLFGRSMHPSVFVPYKQWGQHLGGISGRCLKYSSAAVTSSAVGAVTEFVKLQCSSRQQDPITHASGYV